MKEKNGSGRKERTVSYGEKATGEAELCRKYADILRRQSLRIHPFGVDGRLKFVFRRELVGVDAQQHQFGGLVTVMFVRHFDDLCLRRAVNESLCRQRFSRLILF